MKLKFRYTQTNEDGTVQLIDVTATHYPGYIGKYPEPNEEEEISIDSTEIDGVEVEVSEETLIAIERQAWEFYEGEMSLKDERSPFSEFV